MPRVRFSKMHILNCVYSSSVSKYCIGTGYRSNVYVEACYFDDQDTPWKNYATSSGYTDYNIQLVDNYGASDATSSSGDYTQFIPSEYYTYTANKAAEAGVYVIDETYGAGATLHLEENDPLTTNNVTALVNIPANEAEVVSIEYYNLNGIKMSAPQRGINIVRITYSDGSKKTTRLISK